MGNLSLPAQVAHDARMQAMPPANATTATVRPGFDVKRLFAVIPTSRVPQTNSLTHSPSPPATR